jgi:predicted amidohydrolase
MRSPWLKFVLLSLSLAGWGVLPAQAAEALRNLVPNSELQVGSDGMPAGWHTWSPRSELMPKAAVVTNEGKPVLSLTGDRFECYGQWVSIVDGIESGKFYRFEVLSRAKDVVSEDLSVMVLLTWCRQNKGEGELQRDYVDLKRQEGAWCQHYRTIEAPSGAKSVRVELGLRSTQGGSVLWKDMQLTEVASPPPRTVRVVTTQIVPNVPSTIADNTRLMAQMLDAVGPQKPDVVLFSENLVDRFVRLPIGEKVQPIPGPLTQVLSEKAKKYHTYIITTLHERDENNLYHNTAVLIDRQGNIAGTYRKVHLALAEIDWGLTPGSTFPVFKTDFGRIGIMTCYDNWFLETARMLRLNGAEMIFLPLAGDTSMHWDATAKARAVDNGVYFISSATVSDNQSQVINPAGEVLAAATGKFSFAIKDIDLNQRWLVRYYSVASGVGEPRSLVIKERRPDTYQAMVSDTATGQ